MYPGIVEGTNPISHGDYSEFTAKDQCYYFPNMVSGKSEIEVSFDFMNLSQSTVLDQGRYVVDISTNNEDTWVFGTDYNRLTLNSLWMRIRGDSSQWHYNSDHTFDGYMDNFRISNIVI